MTIAFTVPGRPAPQGSKQAFVNKHTGRASLVEMSGRHKDWRAVVSIAAAERMSGLEPLDHGLNLNLAAVGEELNLLAELFRVGKTGWGWVCRDSTSGRGIRLHQTGEPIGTEHPNGGLVCPTPEDAVVNYLTITAKTEQGRRQSDGV